jgi:hypothetical protein
MNTMHHICKLLLLISGICVLALLHGCSLSPADHRVRDTIVAYLEAKGFEVDELEIKNIEREPLGARQFMGPKRYIVSISRITMHRMKPRRKPMTFHNVTMTIRKSSSSPHGLSVDPGSGITS